MGKSVGFDDGLSPVASSSVKLKGDGKTVDVLDGTSVGNRDNLLLVLENVGAWDVTFWESVFLISTSSITAKNTKIL